MPRRNRGAYLKFLPHRGIFYIQWSERGATRKRSTGTADSREAEAALATFIRGRQSRPGGQGPRDPSQVLVSDVLALYGELHAPDTADPPRIGYAIAALLTFWSHSRVSEVSKEACKAYERHRGRAVGTVRRELTTLRAAINFAYSEGRLTRTQPVWLPQKPQGRDRWLRRAEAALLLNLARNARADTRPYLPLFVLLGLYTGARKEAILALRWPQVDFDRGLLDFSAPGGRRTNKRRARIPIPSRLMTLLRLARSRGSEVGYVVHRNGRRIKDVKTAFNRVVWKAGFTDVTPHTLRHTCGTWLAQRGVPLFEIAGWLGHSHERTVELYAHHSPDFLANAKRAADRR